MQSSYRHGVSSFRCTGNRSRETSVFHLLSCAEFIYSRRAKYFSRVILSPRFGSKLNYAFDLEPHMSGTGEGRHRYTILKIVIMNLGFSHSNFWRWLGPICIFNGKRLEPYSRSLPIQWWLYGVPVRLACECGSIGPFSTHTHTPYCVASSFRAAWYFSTYLDNESNSWIWMSSLIAGSKNNTKEHSKQCIGQGNYYWTTWSHRRV